jgi:hypothetical protein
MPRLVGKQSNSGWYVGLFCVVAIAAAGTVALEYCGIINEIPGFGKNQKLIGQSPISLIDIASLNVEA